MSRLRVSTYVFSAGVAVLGVQRLVAGTAVWPTLPHDVTLAAQRSLALKATEVLHVPVSSFCLRALVCQNNLGERRVTSFQGCKSEHRGFGLTRSGRNQMSWRFHRPLALKELNHMLTDPFSHRGGVGHPSLQIITARED